MSGARADGSRVVVERPSPEPTILRRARSARPLGSRPTTEFLEAAKRRLGWFALLLGLIPVVYFTVDAVLWALGRPLLSDNLPVVFGMRVSITAMSLSMFAATRMRRLSLDRVLLAGLAYEVAG